MLEEEEEEDDWLRLIEERNRYETYSFMGICKSSLLFQTRLDQLESLCLSYDRQINEWKEAELERKANVNSKKEIIELHSKVEKLQEQLNEKISKCVQNSKMNQNNLHSYLSFILLFIYSTTTSKKLK
jgi:signal transduction histidine kinase